ncbi:hypothetical protein SM033_00007 [Vibrio phage vB_VpaM_sm033]|nr:hypothetical protein SM033_00007 [Vibrio phage vB_VpaM_sm033]
MPVYNTLPFMLKNTTFKPTRSYQNCTMDQLWRMHKTINALNPNYNHTVIMPESQAKAFMQRYYDKFPKVDFYFVRIKGWDPEARAMDYEIIMSRETCKNKKELNWQAFSQVDWLKDFKTHINKKVMSDPRNHELSKGTLNDLIRDKWDSTSHEQVIRGYEQRNLTHKIFYNWYTSDAYMNMDGAIPNLTKSTRKPALPTKED